MAFGIKRSDLNAWKSTVRQGKVALLTHYWLDDRFPNANTVTKAACQDIGQLIAWGETHGLKKEWIHVREGFPHFDLIGEWQERILQKERSLGNIQEYGLYIEV
ncbi:hypothetical protein IEE86_01495 [Bacillus sp. 28A-2]|uniref:hypothetical protein n=1 Tax=Bacillus sp. 28A-2 TaxID=2772252 RepID=UPI00168D02DC|nr:hypothetical protein [Bacillus sp. 28A-2]MBD3858394.1 hypothetical protein [Bacillus sp. 28A-2]